MMAEISEIVSSDKLPMTKNQLKRLKFAQQRKLQFERNNYGNNFGPKMKPESKGWKIKLKQMFS